MDLEVLSNEMMEHSNQQACLCVSLLWDRLWQRRVGTVCFSTTSSNKHRGKEVAPMELVWLENQTSADLEALPSFTEGEPALMLYMASDQLETAVSRSQQTWFLDPFPALNYLCDFGQDLNSLGILGF